MSLRVVVKNAVVLGLALFAMFFGAGNLIFPPVIGLSGGTDWIAGYAAYFLADVGLALLGIIAMIKNGEAMSDVTGSIGKVPSILLNTAIMVCIGPLLAIPRTGATSFEMGVTALLGSGADNPALLAIYSVVFFLVVYAATINPGKVVAAVGKILTPVLVVVLVILIVSGVIHPAVPVGEPLVDNVLQVGVLSGYQTMDVLASLAFSIIIIRTVKDFGYTRKRDKSMSLLIACLVAAVLLLLVYGGLAYLGATTGRLWVTEFSQGYLSQAGLLSHISGAVLGDFGAAFLAIAVLFACLTTSIGLVSACAEYGQALLQKKVNYKQLVMGLCIVSALLCNVGLSQIISFSEPILSVLYPVAVFLIVASLLRKKDGRGGLACKCGAAVALVISLATVLVDTLGVSGLAVVRCLPLSDLGFGWVIPALVAAALGLALEILRPQR